MGETIRFEPDKPCLLANRLVRRLSRDKLLDLIGSKMTAQRHRVWVEMVTEALADEIHQDIVDGTLRFGL